MLKHTGEAQVTRGSRRIKERRKELLFTVVVATAAAATVVVVVVFVAVVTDSCTPFTLMLDSHELC